MQEWNTEIDEHGTITINFYGAKAGASFDIMNSSDEHYDNAHCDRALYHKHMGIAKTENMPVVKNGDWFCAMQGKWDKRKSEDAMRDEYRGGKYLDKLVSVGAEHLEQYKDQIAVFGLGNHETSILQHHETDLTERLIDKLRAMGSPVQKGRYTTWVRIRFWFNSKCYVTKNMFMHHGFGGGGPVTRGTIDTARLAIYIPDADVVTMGHVHHDYEMPIERFRLTSNGKPYCDTQLHIRTAGYKDEVSCGKGWAVERGMAPRPKGARRLRFEVLNGSDKTIGVSSCRML